MAATSCVDLPFMSVDVCDMRGTRAVGQPCDDGAECTSGLCAGGGTTCGVCAAVVELGGACTFDPPSCAKGLECRGASGGVCTANLTAGASCDPTADICDYYGRGLFCDPASSTCVQVASGNDLQLSAGAARRLQGWRPPARGRKAWPVWDPRAGRASRAGGARVMRLRHQATERCTRRTSANSPRNSTSTMRVGLAGD